ncbi:UDP-N-acetylmuramate dehydrogenase [Nannocystaceae bacterium ST9]
MISRGVALLARLAPWLGELVDHERLELRLDESMSRHTTLRLGGPADVWARPGDEAALIALLHACHESATPTSFVGSGTNLLVRDGGLRGVVVNLGRLNRVHRPEPDRRPTIVEVEAGCSTGRLLSQATQWELGGVEFLGGVPGSVGGGLIMNAGTYLGEFTNVVVEVRSLDRAGARIVRDHDACGFRYRDSDLPPDEIVVSAQLELRPRPRAEIEVEVAALRKRRDEREPKGVPNNGSTFKNPPGEFAGRLIEAAGLKGTRVGGAVVSDKHANWLVVDRGVTPSCTAADMLELIELVRGEVERVHGVRLETEVEIVGEA